MRSWSIEDLADGHVVLTRELLLAETNQNRNQNQNTTGTAETNHTPTDLEAYMKTKNVLGGAWACYVLRLSSRLRRRRKLRLRSSQICGQHRGGRVLVRREHRPRLLQYFRPRRHGREMEPTSSSTVLQAAYEEEGVGDDAGEDVRGHGRAGGSKQV